MRRDVVRTCADVLREAFTKHQHLPEAARFEVAAEAMLRVAASRAPVIARQLELAAPAVVVDETLLPRLRTRARATIEAVAREASAVTGGDVTPALLLLKQSYRWLTPWRQEAWDRLAREGMTEQGIGLVFARSHAVISRGIAEHRARRAAQVSQQKEAKHAAG